MTNTELDLIRNNLAEHGDDGLPCPSCELTRALLDDIREARTIVNAILDAAEHDPLSIRGGLEVALTTAHDAGIQWAAIIEP